MFCQSGSKRETVYPIKIEYQGRLLVAFTENQVEELVNLKDDYETSLEELTIYGVRLNQANTTINALSFEVKELRNSNSQLTGILALDTDLLRQKTEINDGLRKKLKLTKTVRDIALIAAAVELLIILIK